MSNLISSLILHLMYMKMASLSGKSIVHFIEIYKTFVWVWGSLFQSYCTYGSVLGMFSFSKWNVFPYKSFGIFFAFVYNFKMHFNLFKTQWSMNISEVHTSLGFSLIGANLCLWDMSGTLENFWIHYGRTYYLQGIQGM